MIWFLERPDRLVAERRAVAALAALVDWLPDFGFVLGDGARLILRFSLAVGEDRTELELRYPRFYPDTCPEIVAPDGSLRLSAHQWPSGSLCLEYRADNWRPEITAADLIRSAHRLISADIVAEKGARDLPMADAFTRGQYLRTADLRHVYFDGLTDLLRSAPPGTPMAATMRVNLEGAAIVTWIEAVDTPSGRWTQRGFPKLGHTAAGVVMRVPDDEGAAVLLDVSNPNLPQEWARLCGNSEANPEEAAFVIVLGNDDLRMAWRLLACSERLRLVTPIYAGSPGMERLGLAYLCLPARMVAVVGCGSAGSKVAATLARSGVGRFVLVDDDVLLRGNLVRNDLDWLGVGEHKVDAVATRLRLINPDIEVTTRALRLAGQEASADVDATLELVSRCDLIVDATASADAFNLVSSVAVRAGRPMVWLEAFEGGLGGMVARYRPGIEATPQNMRSAYLEWCRSLNAPWSAQNAGAYATRVDEGGILVADDAEVGVIASHAARFVLDVLLGADAFPHAIYTVALRAGWIFGAPFEVHPLDVTLSDAGAAAPATKEDQAEANEFLAHLIGLRVDETPSP